MKVIHLFFPLPFLFRVQATYFLSKFYSALASGFSCSGEYVLRTCPATSTNIAPLEEVLISTLRDTDGRLETVQTNDNNDPTSFPQKSTTLQIKKPRSINKSAPKLIDMNNDVRDVQPGDINIIKDGPSQEHQVLQVNKEFEELINQENHEEIIELGKDMEREEFMKQLCPVVKTLEQYKGIVGYLEEYEVRKYFYAYGNIGIVNEVVNVNSQIYYGMNSVNAYDLERALTIVVKEDRLDCVAKIFDVRRGITAKEDGQRKLGGRITSFEIFVYHFLRDLAPWKDGTVLKRFLTLHGDELRNKYPDVLDTICGMLVRLLSFELGKPNAEKLLTDLIGQSPLLTPTSFARGFLCTPCEWSHSEFIKYSWNGAIEEGLKGQYRGGGEMLWQVMEKVDPDKFHGDYPKSEEALAAVLAKFPTKQELEDDWNKGNAVIFYNKIKGLGFVPDFLPNVLWSIIFEYALLWTDIDDPTTATKWSLIHPN